ncbi:Tissue factor pathway inhibitor 2 [Halotydeus destructor]|nr:Tissue factor pathway inhibitor 2 [Halotydeus destructor]
MGSNKMAATGLLVTLVCSLALANGQMQANVQAPPTKASSGGSLNTRVVVVHNNMVPVPVECFQPPDSGTCAKDMVRVYYDHETRTCKPFSYTGCGGNANRFLSVKNCYRICHPYRYQTKPVSASVGKQPAGYMSQSQSQSQGMIMSGK